MSVIIPVYNRASLLREAVQSVLSQTYGRVEVIIVDDGSTDDTGIVADQFQRDYPDRIRVIHQPNRGPGDARESARGASRGEYIQYLDSDDVLLPTKFELQVNALKANPACDVSYGKTRLRKVDGSLAPGPWKGSGEKVETMFPSFLRARWWDTPNPLYRASVCERAGPWSELRCEEDWEYDCRIAALGTRLDYRDEYVCEVRERAGGGRRFDSLTLRDRAEAHCRIYQHAVRAGVDPACPEMKHFARELFLLSRECGAAGLVGDSRRLFELARTASGSNGRVGWDFWAYGILARTLGWRGVGRLACFVDHWLSPGIPTGVK